MSDIPVHKMASYRSFMNVLNPGILRLTCTKELIEAPGFNIIPFTARFLELNKHLGPNMPRLVVELFWVKELCTLYPEGSPIRHRLIGQAYSPLCEVYWQTKLDPKAFEAKRARQSSAKFWSFPRNLTKEEKEDMGLVILGNHDWDYTLPEVRLMPIYDVFFLELAKKVKLANPGNVLGLELMRCLWHLLIREVYDFEDETVKLAKLEEARAITQEKYEKATETVPKSFPKIHELSPNCISEAGPSKIRRQRSEVGGMEETVSTAKPEGSGSRPGANMLERQSFTRPTPLAAPTLHQIVNNPLPSVQHGQQLAAERDAKAFRRANPSTVHHNPAMNEAVHQMMIANHELKKANEKILELERELTSEKYKKARLEASLATAEVRVRGLMTSETRDDLSRR